MSPRYTAPSSGGLFGTGIRPQQTAPDYSGLIDSITNAFATTREGVVKRAILQQQAALARRTADREDQQLQVQQQHLTLAQQEPALKENEYASKLLETHNEVDPNAPQVGADGKQIPVVKIGNRGFVLDSTRTPEAKRRASLSALGNTKLSPADIDVLANNQPAYDAYVSAHYGAASVKPTIEEDVEKAKRIAQATRGIPTYADLHPKAGESTQIVQGNDASGNPVFYRIPKQGPVGAIEGVTPKTAAGSGGGQGAQTPVADMQERYKEIEQHASDLAAGKWKIDRAMQTREGLTYGIARETAAGKTPVTKQIGAGVMDAIGMGTGKDFPRYQALMNSTRALGDDVAKVFKGRQNEESVLREVALAQLTPDDYKNPQVVKQKLSRLQNVIHLAEINNPAQTQSAPASTPAGGSPFSDLIPAKKGKK